MENNMEEKEKIIITKYEYDTLQSSKLKYQMLMQSIFYDESTDLTYNKNDLSICAYHIIRIAKVLEPVWYEQVVRKYKSKKEENNNDTN